MRNVADIISSQTKNIDGSSIGAVLRKAMKLFRESDLPNPALDARLLLAEAMACAPDDLLWREPEPIECTAVSKFSDFVARRLAREPIAYILGRREFWKDEFVVSTETLIPRPDSEILIETVLTKVANKDAFLSVLDLGTGSGCLLLSLLRELPNASGIGIDRSAGALAVAQENARRLQLEDRAQFYVSDWFSNVSEPVDILIANPPYIVDKDINDLDPDVRDFEPRSALSGGPDGLSSYRVIADTLSAFIKADGFAAFEIGADQLSSVQEVFEASEFCVDLVARDLAKHDRCLLIRKTRHS